MVGKGDMVENVQWLFKYVSWFNKNHLIGRIL